MIRKHFAPLAVAGLLASSMTGAQQRGLDVRSTIAEAYHDQDQAWFHHSAQEEIAWYGPVFEEIDDDGKVSRRDRTQQLKAAEFDVRTEPTTKYFPRQLTVVKGIEPIGKGLRVNRTTIKELATIDASGTRVFVRFTLTIQDDWQHFPEGWKEVRSHVLHNDVYANGQPSPAILSAISQMQVLNNQIRGFNAANNYSGCMSATQNQKYDYDLRRSYCTQ